MASFLSGRRKWLIGVVHLPALPGAPRWGGDMGVVVTRAVADARAYAAGGAHALVIENFHDVPFTRDRVPAETVAAMAVAAVAIRQAVSLPLGFNVLRNDARAALGLCSACDGQFVRVNVHTGAMLTDQGLIQGEACDTLRERQRLCPHVQVLADVHVKHAVPLGNWPLEIAARDTIERGLADALIVSGTATGAATDLEDVRRVRRALAGQSGGRRAKLLLGSGVTVANLPPFLPWIDGVIVGSSLKFAGQVRNAVDRRRVAALARALGA